MLTVTPLRDYAQENFLKLFESYYAELGCDDDAPHLVEEYILPDLLAGLLWVDLLKDGETYAGFVIYQIDDIDNEWNVREGSGDIREIYVLPSLRRNGLGKFLLYTAEMKLRERGARESYCLPCESAEAFFTACGYKKTQEFDGELECFVFEKKDLNNGDCKKA